MKNVLVTGSTGFIGRNLLPKIINKGYHVTEITRDLKKSTEYFGETTQKIHVDDVNFKDKIVAFKPQIVVHLAAHLTASDEWNEIVKLIDTNLLFLSKVLSAISETPIKLFINTGTFAEYAHGNTILEPAYFYASTKTSARYFVAYFSEAYKFKHTTVVPYTIYGGKDSNKKIIDILIDSIYNEQKIDLSPGEQILDYIHIEDVTDFYMLLIENENIIPNKSNFQLGTGCGYSIKQLADILEKVTGKKTNVNWGGRPYRRSDVMYAVADIKYQSKLFNWTPQITLTRGVISCL